MNLPPLPKPFAKLHHDDGYFTMPARDEKMGQLHQTDVYTAEQLCQAVREAVAAAVPEGWKLVPIEPTQEMCVVDFDCDDSVGIDSARIIYKAMLAASPEVKP